MAPDKGTDPGQERRPAPRDALDRWTQQADRGGDEAKGEDDEEKKEEDGKEKKSVFSNPWIKYGGIALLVILVIAGVVWWLIARQYEDTDDAFIDTHIVHLSPQIAGQVVHVRVNDNQPVRKGQLLVEIDPSDANARLQQAEAQEAQAKTQYEQAVAVESGAAAQAANAARDLERYRLLQRTNPAAVAQQQVDQAVAAARNSGAQRDSARAQIAGALAQIKVDEAQIAAAELNLSYTRIAAPVDGHVAQRSVASGNYVAPGQELMAIVPNELWVTANFKETQLALMRVGQGVSVSVDACAGQDVRGHVQSVQRGAGQAFGILPPENATGNYVKVVQRVPVKIVLDSVPKDCVLGPGMSVTPSVKVR
ncbi:MAG TPA: HlyD family secretion protein [Rhizomicrobium sp.]|jgi:membrane fusion protein (multidrug efflux system)|nr:HlyD family secretion protein [Rhizomicrobium sp.]